MSKSWPHTNFRECVYCQHFSHMPVCLFLLHLYFPNCYCTHHSGNAHVNLFCSSLVFIWSLQLEGPGMLLCLLLCCRASLFQHTETIRMMNYPFLLFPDTTISVTCMTKYLLSSHIGKYSTVAESDKTATHKSQVLLFHSIHHSPIKNSW